MPEAVDHSKHGARIELRDVANAEPGMSPMGIWCNEAQERYVLIVASDRIDEFRQLCDRERCPVSVIGTLTDDGHLVVHDRELNNRPVDMPMQMLLGNPPKYDPRRSTCVAAQLPMLDLSDIELEDAVLRVLNFPAVADKSFLIPYWRPHGRRTQRARPADRPVAGACQRLRDYIVRISRRDRRSHGDRGTHAARRIRCTGFGTYGGR